MKAFDSSRRLIMLFLLLSCVTARPPEPRGPPEGESTEPAADVIHRFVSAARARQFDVVWELLSQRWQGGATVARLTADFDAEPLAEGRLRRVESALGARGPVIDGGVAELPLGPGRALVLFREEAGWRIDRLE